MKPLTLDNLSWKDFYLTDFFQLEKGNQNNMAILKDGNLPLVSAKKTDNGCKQFIAPNGKRLYDGNILTLNNDGDGGAGIAYYQPFQMALDSHCTALIPKTEMSRFHMLFIALCITKQRDRFGHGYSLNNSRLRTFKFMLPVTADNQPDWDFMENYMRQQEKTILKPAIEYLCNQLIYSELTNGGGKIHLTNLNWKEFTIGDLFDARRPTARKEDDYNEGKIQFVASGGINNGVTKFCQSKDNETLDKGNCLTVSPVDGSCYYQSTDFLGRGGAGSSIIILYAKNFELDKYNGLFISQTITQTAASKYSYGRMASLDRIKKDKIILPANEKGEPDFAFMSSFMKEVETDILNATLRYFTDKQQLTPPRFTNTEINWQTFALHEIFEIYAGKRLTKADMHTGNRPFIGATDSNNGITAWVCNTNESLDRNVLGVNYNGSVGETFYHPYPCIFSDDVKRLHLNKSSLTKQGATVADIENKYVMLYLKTAILQQKVKYAYGYKFNESRMLKQSILLPATPDNQPDWDYMETYMRHLEAQQILKVLNFYAKCG